MFLCGYSERIRTMRGIDINQTVIADVKVRLAHVYIHSSRFKTFLLQFHTF